MGLIQDIGAGPVGLDASIFIYFVEVHPTFISLVDPVFKAIDAGRLSAVTSAISLLEVLVAPYRDGNFALTSKYEKLLLSTRGLRVNGVNRAQLRAAALLRSATRIRTPDALQVAAAKRSNCTAFLTNDRAIPPTVGLRVLQLSSYLPKP